MVITRVTYYKCKAPPRTYHYVTLRDKVHRAHLWAGDQPVAHLWGYSPFSRTGRIRLPNVFCALTCLQDTGPVPKCFVLGTTFK